MKNQVQELISFLDLENSGYEEFTPEGMERGIYGVTFGRNYRKGEMKIVIYADTNGLHSFTYGTKLVEERLWKANGKEFTFEVL